MKSVLCALALISTSTLAHADNRAYCGRVSCADALDGCQVTDNSTNPIVLINNEAGEKYHYVSDAFGQKMWSLDGSCACVSGDVEVWKGPGPTFNYFRSATSAVQVDEKRCTDEGL
jgi:hypothetical protein